MPPGQVRTVLLGLGWALVLTPLVVEAVAIGRASRSWMIGHTPDDAFYYLEVARRMGRGQGFTFDGVHATNGFHPLWQVVLAGLGLVVPGQTGFLRASLLLELACLTVALLLAIRVLWRWLGPGPALGAAVLVIHGRDAFGGLIDGMEGAITVLALVLLVMALIRFLEEPGTGRAVLVGLASAVVVLARLDTVVVIWMVPVAMAWYPRRPRWVVWWATGAAVTVPWAIWFWWRYDHFLTTSAVAKRHMITQLAQQRFGGQITFGYLDFVWRALVDYTATLVRPLADSVLRGVGFGSAFGVVVVLGLAAIGLQAVRRGRWTPPGALPVPPGGSATGQAAKVVGVMIGAKALFDVANAPLWAAAWYSTAPRVALALAVGALATIGAIDLLARYRAVGVAAAAALVLVALPLNLGQVVATSAPPHPTPPYSAARWQAQLDRASAWMVDHGPAGRYGAADAGLVGYNLDRRHDVVDLDGLVNNYAVVNLVDGGASLGQVAAATRVDVLVNRMSRQDVSQLGCGRVLWRSTDAEPIAGLVGGEAIYVIDLRRCHS